MSYSKSTTSKFDAADNKLSAFAKALALPIRVAIIRMIIQHGNNISKDMIYTLPYNPEIITKHISSLRTLKIIGQTGTRGNIIYYIDQDLFNQMSAMFFTLLKSIDDSKPFMEDTGVAEKDDGRKSMR
jgi:hypothetical protein